MLGEVEPGGVGSGLYTILLIAIIAVFIGGLMVGRTPEYLGKKIQAREVKLAGVGVLVMPITVLVLTGHRRLGARRTGRPAQQGPARLQRDPLRLHVQGNNNGSAFGGLTGNTPFYNITGAVAMLLGRFESRSPRSRSPARSRASRSSRQASARSEPTTPCSSAC